MFKKTSFLLLTVMTLLSFSLQAQKRTVPEREPEEMFERKLDFFKQHLKLNKKELKAFENEYIHYIKAKKNLNKRYKEEVLLEIPGKNPEKLSKTEQEKIIDKKMEIDKSRCELNTKFNNRLRKVLPPAKVLRFYKLEKRFHHRADRGRQGERKRRIQPGRRKVYPKKGIKIHRRR